MAKLSEKIGNYWFRILALVGAAFIATFFWHVGGSFFGKYGLIVDLAGKWSVCVDSSGAKPVPEKCEWIEASVPGPLPSAASEKLNKWVLYKKTFVTPQDCKGDDLRSPKACAFIFGEIGDSVEASLNGSYLGARGGLPKEARYNKQYPVQFDLSPDLLGPYFAQNTLLLYVRSVKKPQTGLRMNPVGIMETEQAFHYTKGSTARIIFFPLIGAVILGLLFAFGLYNNGRDRERRTAVETRWYDRYCLASALFLLSFTEIPREYLPVWAALHLHFLFRYLSDWAFFELVGWLFKFSPRLIRGIRYLYMAATLTFLSSMVFVSFLSEEFLYSTAPSIPYHISTKIFFLKLLPMVFGLYGAFTRRNNDERPVLILIFATLLLCQLNDIAVFLGFYSYLYTVKFYPVITAIVLGLILMRRHQMEEAIALNARAVVHDIRTPLKTVMRFLNQDGSDDSVDLAGANAALGIGNSQAKIELRQAKQAALRLLQVSERLAENQYRQEEPGRDLERDDLMVVPTCAVVKSVIEKKCLEAKDVRFQFICVDDYFARVSVHVFKRAISNLIDNAVEAVSGADDRTIRIIFGQTNGSIQIRVEDHGKGVPPEVKLRLGRGPVQKLTGDGKGIGYLVAYNAIRSWNGTLRVEDQREGPGTVVTIELPAQERPSIYTEEIKLKSDSIVAILDDQQYNHICWEDRIDREKWLEKGVKVKQFLRSKQYVDWIDQLTEAEKARVVRLFDYDLGDDPNGVKVTQERPFDGPTYIVTGNWDRMKVITDCENSNIPLIPKEDISTIHISIQ